MAVYEVEGPDGAVYHVEGPDNATEDAVLAQVQAQAPRKEELSPEAQTAIRSTVKGLTSPIAFFIDASNALYNLGARGVNAVRPDTVPYIPMGRDYQDYALQAMGVNPEAASLPEKIVTGGLSAVTGTGLAQSAGGSIPAFSRALDVVASDPARQIVAAGLAPVGADLGRTVADSYELTGVPRAALEMGGSLLTSTLGTPAVMGAAGGIKRGTQYMTPGGKEAIAGRVLNRQSASPQTTLDRVADPTINRQLVPNSQPTLAEVSQDPGLARLQRAITSSPTALDAGVDQVNAARMTQMDSAINRSLAQANREVGPVGDVQPFVRSIKYGALDRFLEDNPFLDSLPVDTPSLRSTLTNLAVQHQGKPQIEGLVRGVAAQLEQPSHLLGDGNSFQQVWNQRQNVDDLIYERLATASGGSKAELRHVGQQIRTAMNDDLRAAVPGFDEFLTKYSRYNRLEDALNLGRELAGKVTNTQRNLIDNPSELYGDRMISGAKMDNLDLRAAERKAGATLTRPQRRAFEAAQEEKRRANILVNGGAPGNSHTAQNFAVDQLIQRDIAQGILGDNPTGTGRVLGETILGGIMSPITKLIGRGVTGDIMQLVAKGLLDPEEGARLMRVGRIDVPRPTAPGLRGVAETVEPNAQRAVLGELLRYMTR